MLIAIAGSDGTGKTTIARGFAHELSQLGRSTRIVGRWDIVNSARYPVTGFLSANVSEIRASVALMPPVPRLMFLLWTMHMALAPHLLEVERPIVVVDGYWMKHAASEIAYGVDEAYVTTLTNEMPAADITLLLDAPPERLYERKIGDLVPYECAMDSNRSRESFLSHQNQIRATLQKWAKGYGWKSIDADRPVDLIIADMVAAVSPLIAPHQRT